MSKGLYLAPMMELVVPLELLSLEEYRKDDVTWRLKVEEWGSYRREREGRVIEEMEGRMNRSIKRIRSQRSRTESIERASLHNHLTHTLYTRTSGHEALGLVQSAVFSQTIFSISHFPYLLSLSLQLR